MIFIADLIACSACFGHHYAHHQELESVIQVAAACGILLLWFSSCRYGVELGVMLQQPTNRTHNPQLHTIPTTWKSKRQNTTGSSHLYNTLELLMMGVVVPETCWASNEICNKNHLLHLVGILFPHINNDAQSKSHQTNLLCYTAFTQSHRCKTHQFNRQHHWALLGCTTKSFCSVNESYIYVFFM